MDPFTERMLERARARREKLDAQLGNIGQFDSKSNKHVPQATRNDSAVQKKVSRTVGDIITEKQEFQSRYTSTEMKYSEEFSEKNKENKELESNVRSCVRSRLKRLGAVYSNNNLDVENPNEMPSPSHRSELKGYEEDISHPRKPPAHTVERLAALADNINHWEDDLSHPNIKVKKESENNKNLTRRDDSKQDNCEKSANYSSSSFADKRNTMLPESKKVASIVGFSPKSSPQKPPRTPTAPMVWDQAIIATLEEDEGRKKKPETAGTKSEGEILPEKGSTTPSRLFSPRSGAADGEKGFGEKKLTPKKHPPAVGSVLHKASLFESPTKSPKTKDPTELSVAERKALFEKNKGGALIPKAAFSMAVPAKQLGLSPKRTAAPVKPVTIASPDRGLNMKTTKCAATEVTKKEVSRIDDKAESSVSRVLDACTVFERGQQRQKLENDILKNVKTERQKELDMLLNRWNKQKEADSSDTSDEPEKPSQRDTSPTLLKKIQTQAVLKTPPPPPPLPPSTGGPTHSPSLHSHKSSPFSPNHKSPLSPHAEKVSSLVNVRKIKVSPAKPGCLYPSLSDIDATESEMDQEESDGENESFGDLESSENSSNSDYSVGVGDTSFGREILQATGIQNNLGKKRGSCKLSESEEAVFDEMDELLDEALAEEYIMEGPTPPKRKSDDGPLSPSKTSAQTHRDRNMRCASKESFYDYQEEHLPTHVVDGEQHLPLMHSVSFYRKQQAQSLKTTPSRHVVHSDSESPKNNKSRDYHTPIERKDEEAVQKKIKSLLDEVSIQQTIISQASQALNLCSATVEFSESAEQVEGERLLLVATHRRQAALHEIQRLKVEGTLWPKQSPNGPDAVSLGLEKGDLIISDITLPLKKEFLNRVANGDVDFTHHFVCLIKHQETVISTEMLSTASINKSRGVIMPCLRFNNSICLSGLYSDFKVTLEVYGLQVRKEVLSHEAKYHIRKENSKIRLTPKKILKQESRLIMPVVQSPAGPSAVRSTAFSLAGYVIFSLHELKRVQWTLNKIPYSSPLEGNVHMKLQCHLEQAIEERGFLTMFEDVSGFGAWHRRWCLLQSDRLAYWKYPEDERKKEPIGYINLNVCTTQKVGPVPREICARPNTFLLETQRPALPEDRDTLVIVTSSTHTTIRHLLAADSKEERQLWCSQINKALMTLRAWGPKSKE